MAGSDIPLLNHYKKEFVLKRIPQTLLGGLALKLGYTAPWYIYTFRILLWLMPWIVGGAFTLAVEVAGLMPLHGCIGNGLVVGVLVLLLQISSKLAVGRDLPEEKIDTSSTASLSSKHMRRLLAEEDEEIFESCWSFHTFLFIVPPNRYFLSIVVNSVLSSFICGMGLWYSLPNSTFVALYNFSLTGSVFLYIFTWITLCIANFPLVTGAPIPETAAYRSVDHYGTQNMWRAFHVSLFLFVFLIDLIVDSSTLSVANLVLHIIFCLLPALWLLGIMPPFDALVLWSLEQFLIFVLGGSSMSTDWRLLLMTILSSGVLTGSAFFTSTQALISYSVGFGYFLSTDITSVIMFALTKLMKLIRNTCCSTPIKQYEDESSEEESFLSLFSWKRTIWHSAMFTFAFVSTFLLHFYASTFANLSDTKFGFEIVFICLFGLSVICGEMQRVYIIFGIFRNCLYPLSTLSQDRFLKRKSYLRILGYTHSATVHVLFPLLASVYLSLFMLNTSIPLPSFEAAMGCAHAMRFVWQRPGNALFSFTVFSILNMITALSSTWWGSLFVGTQLIIIDVCRDRFFQAVENVWFALSLLITSVTDKKQKRSSTYPLLLVNIILFPLTLAVIIVASILSAPLLPLFTLPIFMVGFPRPNKFWPSQPGSVQANICPDTMYYRQLVKPISDWFSRQAGHGIFRVHSSCSTSSLFYIARAQDRTLWIQVLESGCGYTSFSMKGLELQETSCHALEATRLDDAFDIAFEKTELDLRCMRTNQYVGTASVTPVDSAFIETYSDSKTSLTGIIDQPDCVKNVRSDFLKSLSWLIAHHILSRSKNVVGNKKEKGMSVKENGVILSPQRLHTPDDGLEPPGGNKNGVTRQPTPGVESVRSNSSVSFTSLLSTDNENTAGLNRNKRENGIELKSRVNREQPVGSRKTSRVDKLMDDKDDWDIESILADSGYGVSSNEEKNKGNKNQAVISKSNFDNGMNRGIRESYVHLNGKDSSNDDDKLFHQLMPNKWNDIPVSLDDINSVQTIFDKKWLEKCIESAAKKHGVKLQATTGILSNFTDLVLACDVIVNIMGVPGRDVSYLGIDHLHQVYTDNIPWSPALDWLTERKDLHSLVLAAFRYAVKLMYDQASLGEVENYDELHDYFVEYDEDWYIGLESDPKWKENITRGTGNLFALSQNKSKKESAVRVLSKQPVSLHSGRVNSSAVRGIWANFALELIYATNDDEERYSIQAHLSMLRNLIVQAADPPLGYPIFSSPPLEVSTLPVG